MPVVPAVIASILVCGIAIGAGADPQPPKHPSATPPNYVGLLERAKAARADNPESVRAVVDAVFDATPFRTVSPSVRERVTKADLAFRTGHHGGISVEQIASAINSVGALYGIGANSSFGRTSVGQIQRYRRIARAMVPFIGADDGHPKAAGGFMSPAEAMYLVTSLLTQQLYNPDFRTSPDQWCQHYDNAAHSHAAPGQEKRAARSERAPEEAVTILNAAQTMRDENSPATLGIHVFLDQLGLDR
jgi:hypothetical protein